MMASPSAVEVESAFVHAEHGTRLNMLHG